MTSPSVETWATDERGPASQPGFRWSSPSRAILARPGLAAAGDFLRLGANESPLAPIPEVAERMAAAYLGVNRYPDISATALRDVLSHQQGVRADQLLIGNGSSELIHVLTSAFGGLGSEIVVSLPTFSLYAGSVGYTEAKLVSVPVSSDGTTDLNAILAAVNEQTSLVFVCNPNNPTGGYLPLSNVRDFLRATPAHVVVALDEAYWELTDAFAAGEPSASALCEEFPNLVILRTFSKFYGLAGLRIGYLIAHDESMVARLASVRPMAMPTTVGLAGALACVEHHAHYRIRAKEAARERARVVNSVRDLGYEVFDTQTNFYCMPFAPGDEPFTKAGIHVRAGHTIQMPGYIRVSLGTPADNDRAIAVLSQSVQAGRGAEDASERRGHA